MTTKMLKVKEIVWKHHGAITVNAQHGFKFCYDGDFIGDEDTPEGVRLTTAWLLSNSWFSGFALLLFPHMTTWCDQLLCVCLVRVITSPLCTPCAALGLRMRSPPASVWVFSLMSKFPRRGQDHVPFARVQLQLQLQLQ
jgi:hypothetical protein